MKEVSDNKLSMFIVADWYSYTNKKYSSNVSNLDKHLNISGHLPISDETLPPAPSHIISGYWGPEVWWVSPLGGGCPVGYIELPSLPPWHCDGNNDDADDKLGTQQI